MSIEVIKSTEQNIEKFKQIYAEDRFKARIFAFENSTSLSFVSYNNVSPGVFQIFSNVKNYGVSKTMKLYTRNKCMYKYIVNKTKFYKQENGKLFPITIGMIDKDFKQIFIEHFSWVRFVDEYNISGITFNTIVRNKLYSRDKLLKFMFGCDYERAIVLKKVFEYREWKKFRNSITNIENFNSELLNDKEMFCDTVALAYKMNQTINAAWSFRRLKEEHDKWSREYTELALELTNRPLDIHPIFTIFNEHLGGGLLKTTKELAIEGGTQKHCVASYSNRVDSGHIAIFNVDGFTAEVVNSGKNLILGQFKGYRNSEAPKQLKEMLLSKLIEFNKNNQDKDFTLKHRKQVEFDPVELPF